MMALFCTRGISSMRSKLLKTSRRYDSGFYVLLPEIGEDLPEKNPLLKEDTLLPEFNKVTIEKCIAAIGKQSIEFEQGIKALEKDVAEAENVNIFTDVLYQIEKFEMPLQTTWGVSKILYFGNQSLMPTQNYLNIQKRAWLAISHKYNSKPIYQACKKHSEQQDKQNWSKEQKRTLMKYILEGKLNGLDLSGRNAYFFQECVNRITNRREEFRRKVQFATKLVKQKISNANVMKGFPEEFLKLTAVDPEQHEVGPWMITLKPHIYQTFMEYCPDSIARWNLWLASVLRCSGHDDQSLQTSILVNGITNDKHEMAKYLGFKTYSEMSMSTKMAGSLENVYNFLDALLQSAFPRQVEEIDELKAFARERGFDGRMEQWDVAYWARKQKRTLYNYDEEILKEYFPLPKVMDGLFALIKNLFNVEIVERQKVDVWHKDVRLFDVYDLDVSSTEHMGSFYFDPYARGNDKLLVNKHSGWVLLIRNKSEIGGNVVPLTSIVFNFQPPTKDGKPSMLTFSAVQALFGNFGHMLQQILTKPKSSEVAGLSNVEWDAYGTSKHVMSYWAYEPHVLKQISCHRKTGEPFDDEAIQKLQQSRTHMSGYNLCKELYFSRLDLDMHTIMRPWERIMKNIWSKHFVFPEDRKDSHVCSWEEIFVDNLGSAYYSDLWSRMLAADVYSAFHEAPAGDMEHKRKIAKRYKETFLSLGGSVHSSEVFRRFRGRDPSLKALLKSLNLKLN